MDGAVHVCRCLDIAEGDFGRLVVDDRIDIRAHRAAVVPIDGRILDAVLADLFGGEGNGRRTVVILYGDPVFVRDRIGRDGPVRIEFIHAYRDLRVGIENIVRLRAVDRDRFAQFVTDADLLFKEDVRADAVARDPRKGLIPDMAERHGGISAHSAERDGHIHDPAGKAAECSSVRTSFHRGDAAVAVRDDMRAGAVFDRKRTVAERTFHRESRPAVDAQKSIIFVACRKRQIDALFRISVIGERYDQFVKAIVICKHSPADGKVICRDRVAESEGRPARRRIGGIIGAFQFHVVDQAADKGVLHGKLAVRLQNHDGDVVGKDRLVSVGCAFDRIFDAHRIAAAGNFGRERKIFSESLLVLPVCGRYGKFRRDLAVFLRIDVRFRRFERIRLSVDERIRKCGLVYRDRLFGIIRPDVVIGRDQAPVCAFDERDLINARPFRHEGEILRLNGGIVFAETHFRADERGIVFVKLNKGANVHPLPHSGGIFHGKVCAAALIRARAGNDQAGHGKQDRCAENQAD